MANTVLEFAWQPVAPDTPSHHSRDSALDALRGTWETMVWLLKEPPSSMLPPHTMAFVVQTADCDEAGFVAGSQEAPVHETVLVCGWEVPEQLPLLAHAPVVQLPSYVVVGGVDVAAVGSPTMRSRM